MVRNNKNGAFRLYCAVVVYVIAGVFQGNSAIDDKNSGVLLYYNEALLY